MTNDNRPAKDLLSEVRTDIEQQDRRASFHAMLRIGIRVFLIVFVIGYMTWLMGSVSKLDAVAITRIAVSSLEERIPQARADLRDYALAMAPQVTDEARDMFIEIPAMVRTNLEEQFTNAIDGLITRFEADVDEALTAVVEYQIQIIENEYPDATPEEQLDAIVLGVSAVFRDTMTEAVDTIYEDYSGEVGNLVERLRHLRTSDDLTEMEQIDKKLLEAWMVLVYRHEITIPKGNFDISL